MRVLAALLCIVVTHAWTVNANVEKTIFLGPDPASLPNVQPGLDYLRLHTLSPAYTLLPVLLPVQFPTKSTPRGLESWYLLQHLQPGQRYEVRICWPATQPTDFWLDTYPITQVLNTPALVSSLSHYSQHFQDSTSPQPEHAKVIAQSTIQSALLLRVQAAASYYSTNRTLMESPGPVDVDIILDPFLLNVLPQSLGPVAIYISAVAVGAYFLSGYVYRWLSFVAIGSPNKSHDD